MKKISENSIENSEYLDQSILNMDIENFIKYQIPLHNIANGLNSQDSEYEELNPDNNISYNIFKKDPLAQFLSSKREFLNKSLDEIVALINEREQIRDSNIYQIEKDICKVHTKMFNLSWQRYSINFDTVMVQRKPDNEGI